MHSPAPEDNRLHLNQVTCPKCKQRVDDQAPACPNCGTKISVEIPADMTPTRNPPRCGVGQTNYDERK
jgi:predicted amidophosphoribosyltransferase